MANSGKRKYAVYALDGYFRKRCVGRFSNKRFVRAFIAKHRLLTPEIQLICPQLNICANENTNRRQYSSSDYSVETITLRTSCPSSLAYLFETPDRTYHYYTNADKFISHSMSATEKVQRCHVSDLATSLMRNIPGQEQKSSSNESLEVEKRGPSLPPQHGKFWLR